MPLYEYQCEACDHRFEVIQKFSDPPVEVCPVCTGTVRKLLSSPAIQFKGSGWYITDYARKGAGSGDAAKTDAKKEPTAGTEPKSPDAKPAETKGTDTKGGETKGAG